MNLNKLQKIGWEKFLSLCQSAKDKDQLDVIFDLLLTPEEKQNMATRILLLQSLLNGVKTQRDIAKELQISISKITRGSNNLKQIDNEFKQFLMKEICD